MATDCGLVSASFLQPCCFLKLYDTQKGLDTERLFFWTLPFNMFKQIFLTIVDIIVLNMRKCLTHFTEMDWITVMFIFNKKNVKHRLFGKLTE